MNLRLGVIGLGRAAGSMVPSLRSHPSVTLAAAADVNPAARARFTDEFGGPAFESAAALCASGTVDAVYIATPHQCHRDDVLTAASYGKHVIVEKPMALSEPECDEMIAATAAADVTLVVGHTHGFDPTIKLMRSVIDSGELGRLRMITNVNYTDFLYRPRRPEELDSSLGGGIMYNQVPHQIEIARTLDGGPLHSVRAVTGVWDAARPTEGALAALLDFEDGAVASLVYSGYDRFDTDEFHFWVGESGGEKSGKTHGSARRALRAATTPEAEAKLKAASGLGGRGVRTQPPGGAHQPHFGMLVASCERGDLRPAADGILIYDDDGVREIALPKGRAYPNKDNVVNELYDAVAAGIPPLHDGPWGKATVAAALALVRSSRDRREVILSTPVTAEVLNHAFP
jgi:phthalate 4,5-cis-dihydrodiol dehydrogenase